MAQTVMQIWQEWFQRNCLSIFFDGLSVVAFRGIQITYQLMQAIRVRVRLEETEIGPGGQLLITTRTPVGCLRRIPIRRCESGKQFERRFVIPRFKQSTSESVTRVGGWPRRQNLRHAVSEN